MRIRDSIRIYRRNAEQRPTPIRDWLKQTAERIAPKSPFLRPCLVDVPSFPNARKQDASKLAKAWKTRDKLNKLLYDTMRMGGQDGWWPLNDPPIGSRAPRQPPTYTSSSQHTSSSGSGGGGGVVGFIVVAALTIGILIKISGPSDSDKISPAPSAEQMATSDAYLNSGDAKFRLGQDAAGMADYNRAIETSPRYAVAYFKRGVVEAGVGRYGDAFEDFEKAIKLNPNYAEAYFCLGNARIGAHQNREAIFDFDRAIELNPNYAEAYAGRGAAKFYLGQYADAIPDLDRAIQLDPNNSYAGYFRGMVQKAIGL